MEKKIVSLLVFAGLLGVLGSQSLYTVHQTERAIVLQLGMPKQDNVMPGLHWKLPFIQNVIKLDARILTYDSNPAEALTSDKKTIVLDNYARWRITDPLLFYQTLRTVPQAQARLVDIVYSELRVVVGRYTLGQLVSSGEFMPTGDLLEDQESAAKVELQAVDIDEIKREIENSMRQEIMRQVIAQSNRLSQQYGVEVIDVRIKRTDLPKENQRAIFGRMQAERERQARQYRSQGDEEARKIRSGAEREVTIMLAGARNKAEVLHGEGDAEAIGIFADAFNQSPEFYEFYRSLDAYKKSLKENSRILLQPGDNFLRFFQ
jgi:membrane protease subunit HflC